MTTSALRLVALAIALLGIVDPVALRTRAAKPDVALVWDERLPDAALVDRVENQLRTAFNVVRGSSLGAAAVVTVGYQLPAESARGLGPAFAVFPEPRAPFATIASVSVAPRITFQERTAVDVRVHTAAARGRTLTVTLRRGEVSVHQIRHPIAGDDTDERLQLQFVPSATGDARLKVEAEIDGTSHTTVDVAASVGEERWAILSFDRRPSWMSTFVRRALENDSRFVVTSRVATSRLGPAVTVGQPPAGLSALPSLEFFDVVIVGAPEALTDEDLPGLQAFLRERGRTVVLLLDQPDPARHSAAFRALTGLSRWTSVERAEPWGSPLASAVLRPSQLPDWAERISGGTDREDPPSVWRTSIGRGSLVVSGALDAWRFRDKDNDAFGSFWQRIVAEGARRASPSGQIGQAMVRGGADERELIRTWSESRGGRTFAESALPALAPALAAILKPATERQVFHPMQSTWWMAPFALALGAEWWTRRRRGLR